ncbi:primase-helicase family protein [Uliginosibacterium sp. H3]|uniref:Primase-helicase family protein n=1 Tax=Uliginosibacterium silvisoli TaxID=3114758 RepID=A0ABU6K427_9RHOO|nr:primase-helicase family protein [Uliginosibacterium sp. H3]
MNKPERAPVAVPITDDERVRHISFVDDVHSPVVRTRVIGFEGLAGFLSAPTLGPKDGPAIIPGHIPPGARKAERVISVDFLMLDVEGSTENVKDEHAQPCRDEHGDIKKRVIGPQPPDPQTMLDELEKMAFRAMLHTSYSHASQSPRYRLVFDLSRPLKRDEVRPLMQYVAWVLGINGCVDTSCMEPARLFFLPRCPSEERRDLFLFGMVDGDALEVDAMLAQAKGIDEAAKTVRKPAPDSVNVIDAYNAKNSVTAVLERCGYIPKGPGRWMHPDSGTGVPGVRLLSATGEVERVFSSHSKCKLADEHSHDAFDCFRILEHGGDRTAALKAAALALGMPAPIKRPVKFGSVALAGKAAIDDFESYLPSAQYLHRPTGALWPAKSVNARVAWMEEKNKRTAPAKWLDMYRPIDQLVWAPGRPDIIVDEVFLTAGWVKKPGARVLNQYQPPLCIPGDAKQAGPWLELVRRTYPDDHAHIIRYLAQRIQCPDVKINHALVLGGAQGIGKDSMLEPVRAGVGPWNWHDVNPQQVIGQFNGHLRGTMLLISETRDVGEFDRFKLYDHCKTIIACPPDVIRVNEKFRAELYVANVMGVIFTTNDEVGGLYLPEDDRRHYVAWSPLTRDVFEADYWATLHAWYAGGGIGHVVDYLKCLDLSGFNPKAPPVKTAAFWKMVVAGVAPEESELCDVFDALSKPRALTLKMVIDAAKTKGMNEFAYELADRKGRRTIPRKMGNAGYVTVRNPKTQDGLYVINKDRQVVYARRELTLAEQYAAADALTKSVNR